jgi:hypothetical protein
VASFSFARSRSRASSHSSLEVILGISIIYSSDVRYRP